MTTLPRCPFRGCPIRYRGGPDRPCPDHQPASIGDLFTRMTDLGIEMATDGGDGDGGDGDHGTGHHGPVTMAG